MALVSKRRKSVTYGNSPEYAEVDELAAIVNNTKLENVRRFELDAAKEAIRRLQDVQRKLKELQEPLSPRGNKIPNGST